MGKQLTATFDAGRVSSDGGVIVLREIAKRLDLAETITGALRDGRDPILAGYEDCDDVDVLRSDPALKIAVGRAPESGADLMSQPMLSRLENLPHWRALARISASSISTAAASRARLGA